MDWVYSTVTRELLYKLNVIGNDGVAIMICNFLEESVDGKSAQVYYTVMPDQRAPDKVAINQWVPRTLRRRLVKAAKARLMKLPELIRHLYEKATEDVELTPDDYEAIAEETRRAAARQRKKGTAEKARKES